MSFERLNDKKVKVNGKTFIVKSHLTNGSEQTETLVLSRSTKKESKSKLAETIHELGYADENDVQYTEKEMEIGLIQIKNKIGDTIPITMILNVGKMEDTALKIIGPSWEEPNHIEIQFNEDDTLAGISKDLLVSSYLLYQERHHKFEPYKDQFENKNDDEPSDLIGGINDLIGGISDTLEDIVKHIEDEPSKDFFKEGRRDRNPQRRESLFNTNEEEILDKAPPEIKALLTKLRKARRNR